MIPDPIDLADYRGPLTADEARQLVLLLGLHGQPKHRDRAEPDPEDGTAA